MADFLNSFIDTVFDLVQLDWFALPFITFVSLFAWCLICYVVWGR